MRTMHLLKVLIILVLVLTTGKVLADEVYLKNGDHMTGKVIRMENKILIFKTSYAGEISMKWVEVASIQTDESIHIILSNETSTRGIAVPAGEGKVQVKANEIEEPLKFDLTQMVIINPKPPEPPIKLNARVNVGLTAQRGNTDTDNVYIDGNFVARTEKNRYTIGGEYNLEKTDDERTANNALGYIKYDHFLNEKWYLYSNALFETDEFKDLDLRTALGVGAGYQFFETELTNLSLEAGLSYVNEDYDEAEDDNFSAGRWSINFDRYLFNKALQFFHYHEGYVSLEDTSDIVFKSRTGFRVPLYKRLTATAQYNYDRDSQPAPGADKVDTKYMLLLGYKY
jgi:putative salt-induced outer membrane protein YdiY